MRFRSGRLIISAFIIYSAAATAQPELLRDDSGTLDLILNAKTAAFAEAGPWFGQADENIGDPANFWWEASVEAGLKGRADFFGGSEVYGAYSFIYAQTVGHDASGLTAGLNNPGAIQTEKAFAGWRSGSLFPQLEKNAIDISGGWQNYTIGSGFLIYNGALNGGSDGAYWIGSRMSFKETAILRFHSGGLKFEAFHLGFRNIRGFERTGRVSGLNLEYSFGDDTRAGFTWLQVDNTVDPTLDGARVYNARVDWVPLPMLPQLSLSAEYAFEKNRQILEASGGFMKLSYRFDDSLWSPQLGIRFAGMQGDNPNTAANENFNPLAYGFSDWGTWYQGEIIGEFVLGNSNLLSYQVALTVNPSAELDLHLLYYHFELDQPAALSTEISASNFADEIDLVADWQIDDRFSLSAVVAVAIPNRAAQEYTGGKTTWVHSMLYASWSL